jgi:hypothetical protein
MFGEQSSHVGRCAALQRIAPVISFEGPSRIVALADVIKLVPLFEKAFRRHKRTVGRSKTCWTQSRMP